MSSVFVFSSLFSSLFFSSKLFSVIFDLYYKNKRILTYDNAYCTIMRRRRRNRRILQTDSTGKYYIYILPDFYLNPDTASGKITSNSFTQSDIINWVSKNITGLPSIKLIGNPIELSQTIPLITSNGKITGNLTWIALNDMVVDSSVGFIYLSIYEVSLELSKVLYDKKNKGESSNTLLTSVNHISYPTFYQLKNNKNLDNTDAKFKTIRIKLNGSKISHNFTNLQKNTFYKILVLTSVENPNDFAFKSDYKVFLENTTYWVKKTFGSKKLVYLIGIFAIFTFMIL